MTQITRDDVLHLAQLSSLDLFETEIQGLQNDIDNIISYIDKLGKLDTDGVEPTYQVTGLKNVWRDDEVIDYRVSREDLLKRSSESFNNQVKVPKVL